MGNIIWDEMRRIHGRLNRIFDSRSFRDNFDIDESYREAYMDFIEKENEFVLSVELPGVEKEDIKLDVLDSGIEIRAEKKQEKRKEDKENGVYRYYKNYSGFARRIELPENVDIEKIDAEYKNGVLIVKVGKKKIKFEKGKEIKIK